MLAKLPPLGWNSWNTFGENISEQLICETADAMVDLGYRDAGYEYVVIDDCWSLRDRDENGRIVPDPVKFPHGMKYVADYVHSKGLKFGMYSCAGILTCAGYPSSYDHEFVDAQTFAEWGVDYLKYDFCNFPANGNCKKRYNRMSMALKASGRPILFSACNWGVQEPWSWMASAGVHMYRSTGDINDSFKSFTDIAMSQIDKLSMSRSGCFNDPDMLIVGMYGKGNVAFGGCNDEEYRSHFAMWCMMGVPLMMGGDIRSLNDVSRNLLQNKGLLAIDQDEECRPPFIVTSNGKRHFLVKHLANNEFALAYFNFDDRDLKNGFSFVCPFDDFGLPYESGFGLELTDAITGEYIGVKRDHYCPDNIPAHGCRVLRGKLVRV